MSLGAARPMAQLRFSCRLATWLAVATVAGSWSVTIESADDLVCKGGVGFSKYGTSTLALSLSLSLSLSLYLSLSVRARTPTRHRTVSLAAGRVAQEESRTFAAAHRTIKASVV